jgi:hypothetical protein
VTEQENGTSSDSDSGEKTQQKQKHHPIALAIDELVHEARDIKQAARSFLPAALQLRKKSLEEVAES